MLLTTRISLFSRSFFFDFRKASFITLIGRQAQITNRMKRSHQLPFSISYEFCSKNAQSQKKEERIEPSQSEEKVKAAQAKETPEIVGNNKSVIIQEADLSGVQFIKGFQKGGNSTKFEQLVQSRLYVDKTLFIEDFINDEDRIIITRPRRFGKSMIIKMIQSYFHPQDTNRKTKPEKNDQWNPQDKDIDIGIFKNLNIGKAKIDHKKYYHKYPCIFFEFLTANDLENDRDVFDSIRGSIETAFENFRFICDDYEDRKNKGMIYSSELQAMEKFLFYLNSKKNKIDDVDIKFSLNFLVNQVSIYYQSDVILLIDEYDMLLNTAFIKYEKQEKAFKQLCDVYSDMIKIATKGKENVYKALMIGILNFAKGVSFSGLNHFFIYPIEDSCFSEYFGFSQQDLDDICNRIIDKEKSKEESLNYLKYLLKYWYNGYQISNQIMYNPFSIVNCLTNFYKNRNKDCFRAYWNNSGDPELIIHFLEKLEDSQLIKDMLIVNERYYGRLEDQIKFQSILKSEKQTIKFLFDQGYLTKKKNEDGVYIIPNNETQISLIEQFITIVLNIETKNLVSLKTIEELARKVANKTEFKKLVEKNILIKISNQDKSEKFFQALLFGINMIPVLNQTKNILHPQHEVKTEYRKFVDSIFLPCKGEKDAPQVGIVQEYKKSKQNDNTDKDRQLTKALWQILARGYLNHLLIMIKNLKSIYELESIIVRATVFYQDESFKWQMQIIEYVYSIEEAKKLNELFTKLGPNNKRELLSNHDDLVDSVEERTIFLENIFGSKGKSIYDLLKRFVKSKTETGKQTDQKNEVIKHEKN